MWSIRRTNCVFSPYGLWQVSSCRPCLFLLAAEPQGSFLHRSGLYGLDFDFTRTRKGGLLVFIFPPLRHPAIPPAYERARLQTARSVLSNQRSGVESDFKTREYGIKNTELYPTKGTPEQTDSSLEACVCGSSVETCAMLRAIIVLSCLINLTTWILNFKQKTIVFEVRRPSACSFFSQNVRGAR